MSPHYLCEEACLHYESRFSCTTPPNMSVAFSNVLNYGMLLVSFPFIIFLNVFFFHYLLWWYVHITYQPATVDIFTWYHIYIPFLIILKASTAFCLAPLGFQGRRWLERNHRVVCPSQRRPQQLLASFATRRNWSPWARSLLWQGLLDLLSSVRRYNCYLYRHVYPDNRCPCISEFINVLKILSLNYSHVEWVPLLHTRSPCSSSQSLGNLSL